LITPAFYKDDKYIKFLKQWTIRLGLEKIKLRQAIQNPTPDRHTRQKFKEEVEAYLANAYQ
jgi:hypothetical protein